MRQIKFAQKRGHWIMLTRSIAAFQARKPENLSRYEQEMFEAAKTELAALEQLLDEMKAEAQAERDAEIAAQEEERAAAKAAGKPSVEDVDPFRYQKLREKEHREKMKK